jgi:hypothetical protein
MAHQDFSQIKHPEVLAAIRNARIKVLFYTERDDRDSVIRQMYGGDIPVTQVSYELSGLQKQEAVIRIGKMPPRKTRLPDLPDIELPQAQVDAFKKRIYQQPWYRTKKEIYHDIIERFKPSQSTLSTKERPNPKGRVEFAGGSRRTTKNKAGANTRNRRTATDNQPDSETVLLSQKGRSTRKVSKAKASGND